MAKKKQKVDLKFLRSKGFLFTAAVMLAVAIVAGVMTFASKPGDIVAANLSGTSSWGTHYVRTTVWWDKKAKGKPVTLKENNLCGPFTSIRVTGNGVDKTLVGKDGCSQFRLYGLKPGMKYDLAVTYKNLTTGGQYPTVYTTPRTLHIVGPSNGSKSYLFGISLKGLVGMDPPPTYLPPAPGAP